MAIKEIKSFLLGSFWKPSRILRTDAQIRVQLKECRGRTGITQFIDIREFRLCNSGATPIFLPTKSGITLTDGKQLRDLIAILQKTKAEMADDKPVKPLPDESEADEALLAKLQSLIRSTEKA